jgi:hypothetical protein
MRSAISSSSLMKSMPAEAFAYTARYDTAIARWFAEREGDFERQRELWDVHHAPGDHVPPRRRAERAEVAQHQALRQRLRVRDVQRRPLDGNASTCPWKGRSTRRSSSGKARCPGYDCS